MKTLRLPFATTLAALAALSAALTALPAAADVSGSSMSSNASSASVGSLSTSVEGSSNSSSGEKKVAAGDYRILEVAAAPGRAGEMRLLLQALQGAGEMFLYVPAETAARHALAAGQVVAATERPYGLEFARTTVTTGVPGTQGERARETFFLALADDWLRELRTQPLTL